MKNLATKLTAPAARLLETVALEAQEAALTGESQPVSKDVDVVGDPDAALADRTGLDVIEIPRSACRVTDHG